MPDLVYQKFVERWRQVTDLPPQTMGPFTPVWKKLVRRLKVMPWPALVLVSIALVLAVYILIGSTITLVVTLLQRGF